MAAPATLAAIEAMYGHALRGEWDSVAGFMAEDLVIHEPSTLPYGGEWRGRDALHRLYMRVMGYWIDPVVERLELIGGERHAVALLRFTVTAPESGNRFSQHVAEVTAFTDDGLMQSMRIHYFDTGEMARQIAA